MWGEMPTGFEDEGGGPMAWDVGSPQELCVTPADSSTEWGLQSFNSKDLNSANKHGSLKEDPELPMRP